MRLCFTGHRRVEGQYPPHGRWGDISNATIGIVHRCWQAGYTEFISGGALGFDQIAAKAVLYVRNGQIPIKLIMALPFPGFDSRWPESSRIELASIVRQADQMFYISRDNHEFWKRMQKRNEWMVDNSSMVIALYMGDKLGGTLNCINYTQRQFKPLLVINPITLNTYTLKWKDNEWKKEVTP